MRLMRLCAAAVLMAGVALAAQPPGGRGGFGGGFGGGPSGLVQSKTVLADLKATEEQTTKLKSWAGDWGKKQMETMKERFQDMQGLDRAEMGKKMAEHQAADAAKAYKELAEVLKPEQITRLKQIEVQMAGAMAFTQKDVQDALKLTEEQNDKLKDAGQAYFREVMELRQEMGLGGGFGGGGGKGAKTDPAKEQEFQKKSAGMTKEYMEKVMGMLTDDQKKAWKTLTGETIDVAKVRAEMPRFGGFMGKKKDD